MASLTTIVHHTVPTGDAKFVSGLSYFSTYDIGRASLHDGKSLDIWRSTRQASILQKRQPQIRIRRSFFDDQVSMGSLEESAQEKQYRERVGPSRV